MGKAILGPLNLPNFSSSAALERVGQANRRAQGLIGQQFGASEQGQVARAGAEADLSNSFGLAGLEAVEGTKRLNQATEQFKGNILGQTGIAAQGINSALAQAEASGLLSQNLLGANLASQQGTALQDTSAGLGLGGAGLLSGLGQFGLGLDLNIEQIIAEAIAQAELDGLLQIGVETDLLSSDNQNARNNIIAGSNAVQSLHGAIPQNLLTNNLGFTTGQIALDQANDIPEPGPLDFVNTGLNAVGTGFGIFNTFRPRAPAPT